MMLPQDNHDSLNSIIARRKELEQELVEMLKTTEGEFTLQHIKDAVFNEEETDDMIKIVAMFDRGGDASELDNILELVSDAWNYFPHRILGGISPVERAYNYTHGIPQSEIDDDEEDEEPFREFHKSIAIIKPKQSFVDWANHLPDSRETRVTIDSFKDDNTVILVPLYDDEAEARRSISKYWEELFEQELYEWCTKEDWWPKNRTKKMFWQWFDVEFHSMVYDIND